MPAVGVTALSWSAATSSMFAAAARPWSTPGRLTVAAPRPAALVGFGELARIGGITALPDAPDVVGASCCRRPEQVSARWPWRAASSAGNQRPAARPAAAPRARPRLGRFSAPLQHNRFDFEPLANELLCAVVRKGHPLCRAKLLRLADLVRWPWVLQLLSSPARQLMETSSPRPTCAAREPGRVRLDLRQAAAAPVDPRVVVLPGSVVRDSLDTGLLRRLPVPVGGKLSRLRRADAQVRAARPGGARAGGLMRLYAARMTKRTFASRRSEKPPAQCRIL